MTAATGRILIVDDDERFLETYRILLGSEGYAIDTAKDAPTTLKRLEEPGWDLVLLDRKLQGRYGPDTGLDLMSEIAKRAPTARIILITGYADPPSIERAFASGAYDYLEKNQIFDTLLRNKVRQALEANRERRMAALANGRREEVLKKTWDQLRAEQDPHRKGALLEDFVAILFKSIPGFERTETRRRSDEEEIDITIPNESSDPYWQRESQYFLGEVKNWSSRVDPKELAHLRAKMTDRSGRAKLGFFIAINGFTDGFKATLDKMRSGDLLVVPIDSEGLERLLRSKDRNAELKKLHGEAVIGSAT
jgi:CheY-like chemotaxis protein